jgi:hypothetical protein
LVLSLRLSPTINCILVRQKPLCIACTVAVEEDIQRHLQQKQTQRARGGSWRESTDLTASSDQGREPERRRRSAARQLREEEETGGAAAGGGGRDGDEEGRGEEEETGDAVAGGGRGDRRGGDRGRRCSDLVPPVGIEVHSARTRRSGFGCAGAPAPATPGAVAQAVGSATARSRSDVLCSGGRAVGALDGARSDSGSGGGSRGYSSTRGRASVEARGWPEQMHWRREGLQLWLLSPPM